MNLTTVNVITKNVSQREMTPEEIASLPTLDALVLKTPIFSANEMLDLFTDEEQIALVEATMSNSRVKLWYDRMIAANHVSYEDLRTEAGLTLLVEATVLSPGRKAHIVGIMTSAT